MADENEIDPLEGGKYVLTEEGVLTAEDFNARQAAGIEIREISEEELAESALKRQEAEIFDAPVTTFIDRAAGAATFGLTDYLRGTESSYEAGKRVAYNPNAALAGELTGAVAPALLSGGAGIVGTAARLTPAGRLAAVTGRIASRGGLRNAATSGLLEGAAGAVGDYISRVSLDDDAEFSADALMSAAVKGGLLGSALGVGGDLVGKAAGKAARRFESADAEGKLGKLLDDVAGEVRPAKPLRILDSKGQPATLKRAVRKKLASESAEMARELGQRIDDVATRGAVQELDELAASDLVKLLPPDEGLDAIMAQARKAGRELDFAAKSARVHFAKYADEVDLAAAKKTITKEAADDTEDALVLGVVETDELAGRFDRLMDEIRARVGIDAPTARAVDPHLGQLAQDIEKKAPSAFARAREAAASAAGVAEVAGTAGVDIPKPSDFLPSGFGSLMGVYLKYKGVKAAARGLGVVPRSKATDAATKVNNLRDRLSERVRMYSLGALKAVERAPATRTLPARILPALLDLQATTPDRAAADVAEALAGTTANVQMLAAERARRAVSYLQATAPKDPLPARPSYLPPWKPSEAEASIYARRLRAVSDPEYAAHAVLSNALSQIEADALRSVYPEIWKSLGQDVLENAADIKRTRGLDSLRRLGTVLGVPVSVDSADPMYGTIEPDVSLPEPEPTFARPSVPMASPSVTLDVAGPRSRPAIS